MKIKSNLKEKEEIQQNFSSLSEGAKLLVTLMSLFDKNTKLTDLKNLFYSYTNNINNKLIDSNNFIDYFNELHEYFIYSKNIDSDNAKFLKIFKNCPRIICDFKKSDYKNYINELNFNSQHTYFNVDTFINSCYILNPLITLLNLNNANSKDVIKLTCIKLENLITEKIITNYEMLYFSSDYEKYRINLENIGDNYNVKLLNKVIDIYTLIPNNKLKEFILSKINIALEALYNPNTNFSYSDIFEIPILIKNIKRNFTSLAQNIDTLEIIIKLYNQIYIVDEYLALDLFEKIAPKEYTRFKEKYFDTIRRFLKQNIINNAIFFEEQDMNEELKYLCDVSCNILLEKYHLEKDDEFYEELMEISDYLYED